MSGVREEILDRRADVLGLPVVKVMIPSACPKLYEQWMASVLATAPGAGSPHGALLWGRPARSWPGDRFVNHDVIPARDAGWTRLEAPSGTGNSKRRGSVGGSSSLASGSITADQASSEWQRLGSGVQKSLRFAWVACKRVAYIQGVRENRFGRGGKSSFRTAPTR